MQEFECQRTVLRERYCVLYHAHSEIHKTLLLKEAPYDVIELAEKLILFKKVRVLGDPVWNPRLLSQVLWRRNSGIRNSAGSAMPIRPRIAVDVMETRP